LPETEISSSTRQGAKADDRRFVVLGCLLFVAGSAIFYMMPAYLALVGGRLSLDAAQLGTLAAAESLAIGISSLTGPLWVGRIDHRLCLVLGSLTCAAGNLATAWSDSFGMLLASRFLVGLLGEGVFYTLSFAVLAHVRNIDRAFAIALTVGVAFGSADLASAATLERVSPAIGPLAPVILIALSVLPLVGWLPKAAQRARASPRPVRAGRSARAGWLALFAQAIWFGAPGAFWTFAEQVATDKGVPVDAAELMLSIGEFASLAGSVAAAWQAARWGRLAPIAVASIGMVLAAILYQSRDEILWLGVLLSVFYAFWNYGTVYQMGLVAELDTIGRIAVMMPVAQVFGQSIGPFCAGRMILGMGDGGVTLATAIFALAGLGLDLICFSNLRRGNYTVPAT
jgi:predicted MFS family arabinose efflux permease